MVKAKKSKPAKHPAQIHPTERASQGSSPLKQLEESLSQGQLERVLIHALQALDDAGVERLVEALDDDSASVVQEVLRPPVRAPKGKSKAKPAPTAGKLRQEWDKVWADWDAVIENTGGEDGPYTTQEHSWEAPYFNATAVADDLAPIGKRLEAFLPAALNQGVDPEFRFLDRLTEADDLVGEGLPDWIEVNEPVDLGPAFTRSLLTWDWFYAHQEGVSLTGFASDVCAGTAGLEKIAIDEDALCAFFLGLDRGLQKELQRGLQQAKARPPWRGVLDAPRSAWFSLYRALCEDFAGDEFLAVSQANIAQDWRLALPVVDALSKKGQHAEAIQVIKAAIRAMNGVSKSKDWDPTFFLFGEYRGHFGGSPERDPGALGLLERWEKAAKKLGQAEMAAALGAQRILATHWQDGPRALRALQVIGSESAAMKARLFEAWRERFVAASKNFEEPIKGWNWVRALIDDLWGEGSAQPAFRQQLAAWLSVLREPKEFKAAAPLLAMLLVEADPDGILKQQAPGLAKQLTAGNDRRDLPSSTRRAWLAAGRVSAEVPAIVQLWREHLHLLIPDPSQATGSHYEDSVDWLSFVRELNPAKYEEIIGKWAVTHKARRNLWGTIRARKLPLPAGR